MSGLATPWLILIFLAAAGAIWVAGIQLSKQTDVLATRLHLGSALGGLILLALATNLPEIAIVASAALSGDVGVAVGNILGGIAIQTVVLVILDAIGVGRGRPLTYRAASLVLVVEGVAVVAVLAAVVGGTQLPAGLIVWRVTPEALLIALLWVASLLLVQRAGRGLPWHEAGEAPDGQDRPRGHSRAQTEKDASSAGVSTGRAAAIFAAAAVVTLVSGVVLERSGEQAASNVGLSGVLFGATVLAAATSLPEVSTGLTSVRAGDFQLAVSDIFGGNAFLPVLFLLATLLSGKSVLPHAADTDIYLTAIGALLTMVYVSGLLFRPRRSIARMGPDSLVVLVLYAIGIAGCSRSRDPDASGRARCSQRRHLAADCEGKMGDRATDESLARRLRHAAIERMDESAVRWRALGVLFLAGGIIVGLSLLLPAAPGARRLPIALLAGTADLFGLALIATARRLPTADRAVSVSLGFGTLLITLALIFSGDPTSPYSLIYVWVGFDAFYFLPRGMAYAQVAAVGAAFAAVLLLTGAGAPDEAGRWVLLVGTLAVVSVLTDLLRSRSDHLIGRLGRMARTDSLTGLLNRRGFEERLALELRRAQRSGAPLALVVVDLDHFKRLNDRFGHHRGDAALRAFAEVVREIVRDIDGVGRIGGEEFGFVLSDTDQHGAFLVAERLRRRVRERLATLGMPVTGSFGIASAPAHGTTADQLVRAADQAMYVAKRLSRDRSVIYSAEVSASFRTADEERPDEVEHVAAVLILAETLDMRDSDTAQHSQTVARYAETIAHGLGLPAGDVERIRLAGLLHDVGKIGVPDPILRKPGKLTDEEWVEMRKHPELGARIVSGAGLKDISDWIIAHHERPDGRGYPHGLQGDEIPLPARILSVADSFEAMTSDRVYRPGMDRAAAVDELRRCAGTQFDAALVEVFVRDLDAAERSGAPLAGR